MSPTSDFWLLGDSPSGYFDASKLRESSFPVWMDTGNEIGDNNVKKSSSVIDNDEECTPGTPDSRGSVDEERLDQAALEQARVRMWAMNFAGGDDVEDYIEDTDTTDKKA